MLNGIGNGIYFGYAGVDIDAQGRRIPPVGVLASGGKKDEPERGRVWPMVMSIGLNPFYKNNVRSVVSYSFAYSSPGFLCGLHPETNRKFI